jgi:hypothetical protein
MNQTLHHIRLAVGLEIETGTRTTRTLDRDHASELAGHLATDLARVLPSADQTLLSVAAGLFEPNELLRPGLPAWQALEELAGNLVRQSGFRPQVVAFGTSAGRMPHVALQPPDAAPMGRFIVLPLLLSCPAELADSIESRLENELFESGSVDPPARALLQESTGIASVHGQLLTTNDLIALQHVQLDSAGLGGFWPVIEQLLLEDGSDCSFEELPAGLRADWKAAQRRVDVEFLGHDQALDRDIDYVLWTRAFRTLAAMLDAHGVPWQVRAGDRLTFDPAQQMMIETAGATDLPDNLTMHRHPDLGLVAWTVVEQGRIMHLYPLRPEAAGRIEQDLLARQSAPVVHCNDINTNPNSGKLAPASSP